MDEPLHALLTAAAVRERAHEMLELALAGGVEGWSVDLGRLHEAAALTVAVTREAYPDLDIPFHARWRHFVAGEPKLPWDNPAERARAGFDLVILSVLLDAGAGPDWRWRDPASGNVLARSEGLAVASQRLFEAGAFSADPSGPLRADAGVLAGIGADTLARGFQADDSNPLVGLEGRAALLRRLGAQAMARPDLFAIADAPRPGGLYDALAARAEGGRLEAAAILELLLEALGPIWADRLVVGGVALGDCWRHPAIKRDDAGDGLVPLHKLSQWLAYSLIEPLQAAGIEVIEIDALTGLPEYRNGGLFIDLDALVPANPSALAETHTVDSLFIVEWRALTVALLDDMAERVRARLELDASRLPLACVLEGGTWAAGRRIARQKRADGSPPLKIE
ncbi:MAG: hypothetical protein JWO81_781, partial [Alphaproteobacteria bacterium]|nr:hypothetical protein [Alphaproteobacteria bacterium]